MKKRILLATFCAVFVNIMWGLSFIASKVALGEGFEPFSLALVRYVLSTLILLPVMWKQEGLRFPKGSFWAMLASALTGSSLYFFFEYNGLERTAASTASLIIAAIPVMQLVCDAVFHRCCYRLSTWAGVLASVLGVYLLVAYGQGGESSAAGCLFMFGACLCWIAYHEVNRDLLAKHGTLSVTFWSSLLAMLTLIPCAAVEHTAWAQITPTAWFAALFLAVICSALCYLLYNVSIRVLAPARTALYLNLNPIAGCLGGVLILSEQLTFAQILGGVIILASVLFVNRTIQPKQED